MLKITSPLAAPVCGRAGLSPEAQRLVTPSQTPAQYVAVLEENGLQQDAVKFMVYGMEEKDAVCYATKAAQQAVDPANLADQEAIRAAETWMRAPKDAAAQAAAQKAAGEAAAKAAYETPGAWAAQAAAWARSGAEVPAVPGVPSLSAHAAYGAIQLAAATPADRARAVAQMAEARAAAGRTAAAGASGEAAGALSALRKAVPASPDVPQTPDVGALARAKVARAYQPYSDLGKQIASGRATCV